MHLATTLLTQILTLSASLPGSPVIFKPNKLLLSPPARGRLWKTCSTQSALQGTSTCLCSGSRNNQDKRQQSWVSLRLFASPEGPCSKGRWQRGSHDIASSFLGSLRLPGTCPISLEAARWQAPSHPVVRVPGGREHGVRPRWGGSGASEHLLGDRGWHHEDRGATAGDGEMSLWGPGGASAGPTGASGQAVTSQRAS